MASSRCYPLYLPTFTILLLFIWNVFQSNAFHISPTAVRPSVKTPFSNSLITATVTVTVTTRTHHDDDQTQTQLHSTTDNNTNETPKPTPTERPSAGMSIDHIEPEEAIIHIAPKAMIRLRELKTQMKKSTSDPLILKMGIRNGGCSGLSYVMDFATEQEIEQDDIVDEYNEECLKCVVDAKSMLYLFGLELDYSDELIGGGFKFFNPNAEESCGCGSSFGV